MNKKLLLAGIAVTAGFVFLTAFGPKQDQQKQEIAAAVTARLDEFRAQKEEECTMKVNAEAQTRYQAYLASKPVAPEPGKTTKKKTAPKKVSKDPLPQTAPTTNPKQEKMQGTPNTEEKKEKMQEVPNTDKKKQKMQGGGR
ncbi:MAG: hypothetical protein L6Q97_01050 [Thermoanaerobaculia bacterium]|nr:hypothetical protein [Thermoanaerobaculia bacterium]